MRSKWMTLNAGPGQSWFVKEEQKWGRRGTRMYHLAIFAMYLGKVS